MDRAESEADLIARATGGDELALEPLLLRHHRRLLGFIQHKLPESLRGFMAAEDVLQLTYTEVFRHIKTFGPQGSDSFYHWLTTIAEHRLVDVIRAHKAAKRGGGRRPADVPARAESSSVLDLLALVNVDEHTPSRSAARHEAGSAIHVALAGLRDDYRQAICLRYLEGLPVADVAARMDRTPRAVHMLCHRGLQRLRESLGRASDFLSAT